MKNLVASIKDVGRKGGMIFKKHAPTICFVGGVGLVVGGTILACRATLKVPEIIEDRDEKLEDVKIKYRLPNLNVLDDNASVDEFLEAVDDADDTTVITKDEKREIFNVHARTALCVVKEYIPAVIVGGVGIALLTKSHTLLTKRYLAMTAAYGALQSEFMAYRKCVIDEYGEEVDKRFIFGAEQKTISFVDENGEEHEETKDVYDLSKYGNIDIATRVLFDEKSRHWENNASLNKRFIDLIFYNANEKLIQRGKEDPSTAVLFINEINKELGIPLTPLGNMLGYKYDPNRGSAQISYDILNLHPLDDDYQIWYKDDNEPNMWIRYNIDGNVLQYL